MCTIILNLSLYTLMLCPKEPAVSAPSPVLSSPSPSPSFPPNAVNVSSNNDTFTNDTYTQIQSNMNVTYVADNISNAVNATHTTTVHMNVTYVADNISNAVNATHNTTVHISLPAEICNTTDTITVYVPSPAPPPAPSCPRCHRAAVLGTVQPNISKTNATNSSDYTKSSSSTLKAVDTTWLHLFWLFVPVIAVAYGCARRLWCTKTRIGFWHRKYSRRSQSWPTCEHSSHPARIPRSRSADFDTIVL